MQALLIGSPCDCCDTLEAALRAEGYDVHHVEEVAAARSFLREEPPALVVLAEAGEEALAFCRSIRHGEGGAGRDERPAPIVLAVASPEKGRALAEDEAVDDLIFSCEQAAQVRTRVALAGQRAARRAQAESRVRRENERIRDIFESITSAFIAVDTDWCFTFVNKQAERLLDRKREALLGACLWEVFPEAKGSVFEERYREALNTGEAVSFEAPFAPLGGWFDVSAYPFAEGLSIYFDDVTERHRTQQALRESEAKARAVLETTVDGIITIDRAARIESFNQAAEDIFGYAEEEVKGRNVKMLMPEPYRSEHDSYIRNYHETGRRKIIGLGREVEGRRKDGSVFPMELAVSEVQVGEERRFTGIVRDISERRRLEREVLKVSEEERRRIGQDLHDNLGQLLTGVGLLSRSLARRLEKDDLPAAEEAAKIERLIREADEQARVLARGLVPVDMEAQGLTDALRRLTAHVEDLSEVKCTFREAGTGAVYDNTVATHLFRIAQEAANNAIKHGQASHIALMLASGPERTRLRIKDDGMGFPREEHERHETQIGGLGVRTMNYRARLIGATLDIHSIPGEGTSVTCTLRSGAEQALPLWEEGDGWKRDGVPEGHAGRRGAGGGEAPGSGSTAIPSGASGCPFHAVDASKQ